MLSCMFIDFWCEIYESVKRKPSRTILTGIGISWGIFILIVLVGIGLGFERGVFKLFNGFSKSTTYVYASETSMGYKGAASGRKIQFQKEDLKQRCHVVIGTPGRVLDHLQQETLDPSKIKYVVLDEADEMLNMNFLDEVQAILKYMPKKHVTCLFSATYPAVIQRMSKKYLYKPAKIDLTSSNKPNILEEAYHVNEEHKELFLLHLLALKKPESLSLIHI